MTDSEIDAIYEKADALMWAGKIDEICICLDNCGDDIDECISWLSSTIPVWKKTGESRRKLIDKTKLLLLNNGEDPEKELMGLELKDVSWNDDEDN